MDSNSFSPSGQGSDNNNTPPNNAEVPTSQAPSAPSGDALNPPTNSTPVSASAPEPISAPTPISESIPISEPTPVSEPITAPEPIAAPEPTSVPEPTSTPEPTLTSTPEPTPAPAPHKKSTAKIYFIIGALLMLVAVVIVVVFLIPFGEKTLWDSMTGSGNGGSEGGTSGGGTSQSDNTITTGDYTYTANLDLDYQPRGTFHDGLLRATDNDGNTVFLDTAGKLAFTLDSSKYYAYTYHNFSDGLLPVQCKASNSSTYDDDQPTASTRPQSEGNKYGYLDKTGKLKIPCQYGNVQEFKNGYAAVSVANDNDTIGWGYVYGVIDTEGKTVVDFEYDNIQYESGTFLNRTFKGYKLEDSYTSKCYNFAGEVVKDISTSTEPCAIDPESEENEETVNSIKSIYNQDGKDYRFGSYKEGLMSVHSISPLEYFFVNSTGDWVWGIDTGRVIDIDDNAYQEGLFRAYMWVGEDPYPGLEGFQQMADSEGFDESYIYKNAAVIYYDHSGNPVFTYRYAKSLSAEEDKRYEEDQ